MLGCLRFLSRLRASWAGVFFWPARQDSVELLAGRGIGMHMLELSYFFSRNVECFADSIDRTRIQVYCFVARGVKLF